MQLFGLRKTPDLSHVPRQALMAFEHERAQIQRRAVLREPPVRTFWQILRTQGALRNVISAGRDAVDADGAPDEGA